MEGLDYRTLYPDGTAGQMDDIEVELEWITPQKREFLLLWLREKTRRGCPPGFSGEVPLFQGSELAGNMVKAFVNDDFHDFDILYLDHIYRCSKDDNFSPEANDLLAEYLDEKKTLYELSLLSEHLTEGEMTQILTKVLREEPKNDWYDKLISDCEDSIALRRYYADVFGVPEEDMVPVKLFRDMEKNAIMYMSLAEGAEPEAVMFIKKVRDTQRDISLSVFCHEDPCNDGNLEYFTISPEEAGFIPVAARLENDSNSERFSLWLKETIDFSDDVYLKKPSVTDVAKKYAQHNIVNLKKFSSGFNKALSCVLGAKEWSFGKGKTGKMLAEAPAYAKIKAFRLQMVGFEISGKYSIPYKELLSIMQEEIKEQQEMTENVFSAMRRFAELGDAALRKQEKDAVKAKEETLLKEQGKETRPAAER